MAIMINYEEGKMTSVMLLHGWKKKYDHPIRPVQTCILGHVTPNMGNKMSENLSKTHSYPTLNPVLMP